MDKTENQINDVEHKNKKQAIRKTRRQKNPKKEDSISNLWDNFKRSNTHVIWDTGRRGETVRNW